MDVIKKEFEMVNGMWNNYDSLLKNEEYWYNYSFKKLDFKKVEEEIKRFQNYSEDYRKSNNEIF